jgi:hypothetical protein
MESATTFFILMIAMLLSVIVAFGTEKLLLDGFFRLLSMREDRLDPISISAPHRDGESR